MTTLTIPATKSLWRDEVLNITYLVIGVSGAEALVVCRHGNRRWNDAIHLSLFNSELTEVN